MHTISCVYQRSKAKEKHISDTSALRENAGILAINPQSHLEHVKFQGLLYLPRSIPFRCCVLKSAQKGEQGHKRKRGEESGEASGAKDSGLKLSLRPSRLEGGNSRNVKQQLDRGDLKVGLEVCPAGTPPRSQPNICCSS